MKLTRIAIKNFRSIEHAEVDFSQHSAKILVGINESGKSNLLKAMALLSDSRTPIDADKRTERRDEDPIKQAYVHFIFTFSESEVKKVYASVAAKFFGGDLDQPLFRSGDQTLTLHEFCKSREGLYRVDLMDCSKDISYFSLRPNFELLNGWKKLKPFESKLETHKVNGSTPISIAVGTEYVNSKLYALAEPFLAEMMPEEINNLIGHELVKIISKELPKCIFWEYDEKNLFPSQVSMDEFQEDPDTCIPLRNCFEHAGFANPGDVLKEARKKSRHAMLNLLGTVGDRTTTYIQSVWKDYKNVALEFHPDGQHILPIVKDKSIQFDFHQRSDGFKRFVTFLLMISSKVKSNKITNTLILIDEPEIGLHPSGARNLMMELLRISEKNTVVYSTHSIFMIDKQDVDRHTIVEKKEEITIVKDVDKSRITDEEVIYKAIGFSLLEILRPFNIVFEGWRDKHLFEVAKKIYLKEYKGNAAIIDRDKKISICHAEGVKDIRNIAPLIELAGRELLILSDSDSPAVQQQEKHIAEKMYGTWKTYQEITKDAAHSTSEDFLTSEAIIKKLSPLKKNYPDLPPLTEEILSGDKGKIAAMEKWIGSVVQKNERAEVMNEIKTMLFDNLKDTDIDGSYIPILDYIYQQ